MVAPRVVPRNGPAEHLDVRGEGALVCDDVDCQLTCEAQGCLGGACASHGACRCIGG